MFGKPRRRFLKPVAAGFVEFDDFGNKQRLAARNRILRASGAAAVHMPKRRCCLRTPLRWQR